MVPRSQPREPVPLARSVPQPAAVSGLPDPQALRPAVVSVPLGREALQLLAAVSEPLEPGLVSSIQAEAGASAGRIRASKAGHSPGTLQGVYKVRVSGC